MKRHYFKYYQQQGAALFIALVALVSMTLAAMALVRSVDTSNQIAGNFAFRQATLHAADVGMEDAIVFLKSLDYNGLEKNFPAGCAASCRYFSTMQPSNSYGVPRNVNWSSEPVMLSLQSNNYQIRYVIDRLCIGAANTPVTDVAEFCVSESGSSHYRITVHVTGPRSTSTMVQSIFRRPRTS